MQEKIEAARVEVENLKSSPVWPAHAALSAVLDALEAVAAELSAGGGNASGD